MDEVEQELTLKNSLEERRSVGQLTVILNGTYFDMDKYPDVVHVNGTSNGKFIYVSC